MSDNPFDNTATATEEAPAKAAPKKAAAKPKTSQGDGFDTAAEGGEVKQGKAADPFSVAGGFSDGKITDYLGELLLVKPTEVIEEMDTEIGTAKDVVRADVTVLSGDEAGETFEDMLVFQVALKRALIKVLDGPNPFLLGRLGKGAKKAGKSAPYIFETPTPEDVAAGRAHLGLA